MRFVVLSLAILAVLGTCGYSQQKSEENERPRLFQGGLIKKFENLQERLKKEREERLKKREEEAKKKAEKKLKANEKRNEDDRKKSESIGPQDPFAPTREIEAEKSSRRSQLSGKNGSLRTGDSTLNSNIAPTIDNNQNSSDVSLGVQVRPAGIATSGLIVDKVSALGAAKTAGIQVSDRIVSVGGSPIKKIEDLDLIMSAFEPGDRTEVEIIRKNKKKKILIQFPAMANQRRFANNGAPNDNSGTTEELPNPNSDSRANPGGNGAKLPPVLPLIDGPDRRTGIGDTQGARNRPGIGVTAVAVDPVLFDRQNLSVRQGAYIDEILPKSAADKAGLQVGDVVIAVDGRKVDSAISMAELIQTYKPGDKAQLLYYRQNRLKRTQIQLDAVPASQLDRFASQPSPVPESTQTSPPARKTTVLGELSREFPRLKRVEDIIDRFTPREERADRAPPNVRGREAELENEVRSLRNRLRGQDQQIKSLTEKLTLIEKILSERQAEKNRNNRK